MNSITSKYLEILRVISALGVLLYHSSYDKFSNGIFDLGLGIGLGHLFVIIFFVLSGYVVSYAATCKDSSFLEFSLSRVSRFLSVVIPALFIVPILDAAGASLNPSIYDGSVSGSYLFFKFFINLFFLQEIWFESVRYSSNGPMWSLGYEFWYYFIFASLFYLKGYLRLIVFIGLLVLVGPKILLLIPIWLSGSFLYFFQKKIKAVRFPELCFFFSFFCLFLLLYFYNDLFFLFYEKKFSTLGYGYSSGFIFDYAFSFFVVLMVFFVKYIESSFFSRSIDFFYWVFDVFSKSSFTIYLMHFPIMLFVFSVFDLDNDVFFHWLFMVVLTVVSCVFLSRYTEQKRHILKKALANIFVYLKSVFELVLYKKN